jgi:hypothetical protein
LREVPSTLSANDAWRWNEIAERCLILFENHNENSILHILVSAEYHNISATRAIYC